MFTTLTVSAVPACNHLTESNPSRPQTTAAWMNGSRYKESKENILRNHLMAWAIMCVALPPICSHSDHDLFCREVA